ncbi:MAG: ribosome maturation factor RimM [Cyclobacteriaceae bacterium]|jgi:16S rRNA processing protein RimM|nr:ribosome maturation factor RimM [Cyclobacteriaceae bacterium]
MRVDECYQLGYVTKAHGLKGELQIFLDVDIPDIYRNMESMFVLRNDALVPFFLKSINITGSKALVKLEDINHIDDAKALVSSEIYLPLSFLPELKQDQYYFHEIIGFDLFDGEKHIGKIKNVYILSPQNLIEADYQGTDILVPMNEEVITSVNKKEQRVYSNLPHGLLEVYLDDHEN